MGVLDDIGDFAEESYNDVVDFVEDPVGELKELGQHVIDYNPLVNWNEFLFETTGSLLDRLTGRDLMKEQMAKAEQRIKDEQARRAQMMKDQQEYGRRLDVSRSLQAQAVRTTDSRMPATSAGQYAGDGTLLGDEGDYLGL